MCGIVGFLDKRGGTRPVGRALLALLDALACRGPDSAGVAVFGPRQPDWVLRLALPGGAGVSEAVACTSSNSAEAERWASQEFPGAEIVSLGRHLQILKQVGSPSQLEAASRVSQLVGTHGIGHTRLSTESRVDLSHSQPFWAHGVPDLATVHNGHITNYHKLRRHYEQRGHRFYTENDSEVIGVYLRDRLAAGLSLEDALRSSLDDFDGSFSYLAASADRLAYVRDRFGFKPLVIAETEEFVAIATEEIALRRALGNDFVAREPAPGTMRVWPVAVGSTV
jgi:glutamine phosphoribosylpyrophosphate amidotransferase